MNKLNIGYDHYEERTNFYNGAPHKDCDWLEYREYYGLDITEVDVNTCGDFYIFPVNALWAKFELFEEKTFFGNYLSEKVIKDLQSDKCLLHINWINGPLPIENPVKPELIEDTVEDILQDL